MKEKGLFFTEEQIKLLKEVDEIEKKSIFEFTGGMPERVFDDRKKLTVIRRMEIAKEIQSRYSMLDNKKGIFDDQLFSAMEEYLKACNDTGYRLEGL